MENENIRTIEIAGQKFEVDLRTIRKLDQFRVGDRIKLLIKDYSSYKVYPGVIVGIENFKNLPTVVIAYVNDVWGANDPLKFAYLNSESKDMEMCPMSEDDVVPTRGTVLKTFDAAIKKAMLDLEQLQAKREYFLTHYRYPVEAEANGVPVVAK